MHFLTLWSFPGCFPPSSEIFCEQNTTCPFRSRIAVKLLTEFIKKPISLLFPPLPFLFTNHENRLEAHDRRKRKRKDSEKRRLYGVLETGELEKLGDVCGGSFRLFLFLGLGWWTRGRNSHYARFVLGVCPESVRAGIFVRRKQGQKHTKETPHSFGVVRLAGQAEQQKACAFVVVCSQRHHSSNATQRSSSSNRRQRNGREGREIKR